ncbi:hypothetical protein H4Q26_002669 [Puccinia striiformis f. sp. tritici PST-130]|nr:hypothetical protein H4Q26_002669 [Puccinia striiformis f. sp. tritici PST-130]
MPRIDAGRYGGVSLQSLLQGPPTKTINRLEPTLDRMPSRPPFLSELTPSTSGIVLDPTTGNREVATSKRPDGTWTRPGFTPHEDVSKFRSARQSEFESKKLPKEVLWG